MMIIPTQPVQSQEIHVNLAGQNCKIIIYTKTTGVFMDVYVLDSPIIRGFLCVDKVSAIRYPYLGFIGSLVFVDTQGQTEPHYSGLGSRYQLVYLEASDIA